MIALVLGWLLIISSVLVFGHQVLVYFGIVSNKKTTDDIKKEARDQGVDDPDSLIQYATLLGAVVNVAFLLIGVWLIS